MTREELIRKRKQKKAIRFGLKVAGVILAAIVLMLMIRGIGRWIKNRPKKPKPQTEETVETVETPEVKEDVHVEGDTAQLVSLGSAMTASKAGWNVNDNGWFYSPDLTQMYSSGWKTLDGDKYYFKEDGYMATGWTNVGEVKDKYFDISGRVDETKQQKLVALTFDDGPAENTSKLLDILEKYNVKATFFVVGEQADYYRETLKREADLGMEIGSHTWDHPWLNQLSEEEIREALDACMRQNNDQVILLKCCSQYPAQFEDMNLSVIPDMEKRFGVPVGLSDHSLGSLAPVIATSLGAKVIEKHVRLDEDVESADAGFSMTMKEFAKMVTDVRNTTTILGNPTYELTEHEKNNLPSRRSLVAVKPIKKGEVFTKDNIRSIRPAIGIKPKYMAALLGKEAKKDYEFGDPITMEEVEFCHSFL